MRASEALMIGSALLKFKPYCVDDGHGFGCAIGMVNLAKGRKSDALFCNNNDESWAGKVVPLPCDCRTTNPIWSALSVMIHLFNEHVCKNIFAPTRIQPYCGEDYSNAKEWTIEQLADWLESIDPTPKETAEEKREAVEIFCEQLVGQ